MDKSKSSNTMMRALIITVVILIIVLLIYLGPRSAEAVSVTVTPSSSIVVQGSTITFDVSILIETNERIPVNNTYLRIFSDSGGTVQLTSSPYNSPRNMSLVQVAQNTYGYGSLYGYDYQVGQGHNFGYGYGYGGATTLVYRCTMVTTGWPIGAYYVRGDVNSGSHTFSSSIRAFSVVAGGGGAGGGGGIPQPAPTSKPTSTPTPLPTQTLLPTVTPTIVPTPKPSPTPTPTRGLLDLSSKIDKNGVVQEYIQFTGPGPEGITLRIAKGTSALTKENEPLQFIEVNKIFANIPPHPDGTYVIGDVYDLSPDGATFNPPIDIIMKYYSSLIPAGISESKLFIAYYDTSTSQWEALASVLDSNNDVIAAQVRHFTKFAVLGSLTKGAPFNAWLIAGPILAALVLVFLPVYYFLRLRGRRGWYKRT